MLLARGSPPLTCVLAGTLVANALFASPGRATVTLPVRAVATTIANSTSHTVLVAADGTVWGAGGTANGELTGPGNSSVLVKLTGLPAGVRARAVSAASKETIVLGSDGIAYGAGANVNGQLTGDGARQTLTPLVGLPTGVMATAVSTSGPTVVVLGSDGIAYGAGDNSAGQLTGADTNNKSSLTPMPLSVPVVAVAAGELTTLLLGIDGVVYGVGRQSNGLLCTTASTDRTSLQPLAGLPSGVSATAINANGRTSVILGSNGVVYGCGLNSDGQLTGTPTGTVYSTMRALSGLPGGVTAKAVSASLLDTIVLGSNGVAYGAGSNANFQLTGADSLADQTVLTPLSPAGPIGPISEVASAWTDTVVRDSDGVVYGAGNNLSGQLTSSDSRSDRPTLTPLADQPLAAAAPPGVTGTARVGSRLAASTGEWSPTPTAFSYQWLRSGTPISDATGTTYALTAADLARTISVEVTATRTGFAVGLATSTATGSVARGPRLVWSPKGKPTIKVKGGGPATVGRRLRIHSLTKSRWSPDATDLDYRWTRNGKHIKHATHKTYRLTGKDRGKKIRVIISAKRAGYATGTLTLHHKKVAL